MKRQIRGGAAFCRVPAAFRRLCVETSSNCEKSPKPLKPAAFRRLCVETFKVGGRQLDAKASRLQAAVC